MLSYVNVDEMEKDSTRVQQNDEFFDDHTLDETPIERKNDTITYEKLLLIIDLYIREEISFGKAVELSNLGTMGFLEELKIRKIKRITDIKSIEDELEIFSDS